MLLQSIVELSGVPAESAHGGLFFMFLSFKRDHSMDDGDIVFTRRISVNCIVI